MFAQKITTKFRACDLRPAVPEYSQTSYLRMRSTEEAYCIYNYFDPSKNKALQIDTKEIMISLSDAEMQVLRNKTQKEFDRGPRAGQIELAENASGE